MAREARLAVAGELHHLLQRGHNGMSVFVDDHDRQAYLAMLREAAVQNQVAIHAYAQLDNEVHLLATPAQAESLGRMMQSLGRRYVAAFNRRHGRSGTLWAGRFCTSVIDGAAFGPDAVVYIETLPVRRRLAQAASEGASSAAHHLGRWPDPLITEHPNYWAQGNTPFERELAHANKLSEGVPDALARRFEQAVMQGRPVGSVQFAERLAQRLGRQLQPRPRGRPRKNASAPDLTMSPINPRNGAGGT